MVFILKDSGSGSNLIKYGPILVGSARVIAGGKYVIITTNFSRIRQLGFGIL